MTFYSYRATKRQKVTEPQISQTRAGLYPLQGEAPNAQEPAFMPVHSCTGEATAWRNPLASTNCTVLFELLTETVKRRVSRLTIIAL